MGLDLPKVTEARSSKVRKRLGENTCEAEADDEVEKVEAER